MFYSSSFFLAYPIAMKKLPEESSQSPPPHTIIQKSSFQQPIPPENGTLLASTTYQSLREIFIKQLKASYGMELQQVQLCSKFMESCDSQELADILVAHRTMTEFQITRCEEIFAALKLPYEAVPNSVMLAYYEEASTCCTSNIKGKISDSQILLTAQQGVMYEIGTYRILSHWARLLHEFDISNMLEDTLSEEIHTSERLSIIGKTLLSSTAMQPMQQNK